MKKSIVIISFITLSILSFFSCSKSNDASLTSFSGIKIRVDGTEYTWPQAKYQFIIEKVVSGGVTGYGLRTRTPSSPEVNSIGFGIPTSSLTPGVYKDPKSGVSIKINRTTSSGYFFMPKLIINYYGNIVGGTSDFRLTLSTKTNGLGTGDFSMSCWNTDQRGVGITSQEYSIQGNFYNIPILE